MRAFVIVSCLTALFCAPLSRGFTSRPLRNTCTSTNSLTHPCDCIHTLMHQQSQHTGRGRGTSSLFMGRRSAKIANRKGASDAKKAKVYARMGKRIVMAVKAGGPDPIANRLLADVMKEATAAAVPKDNVMRAIKKASDADTADFKEATYEAYGFGGVGIIINALTDNANRANAEIRTAAKKADIKMANSGSVLFNFDRKGKIEVEGTVDEELVIETAIENDIDDAEVMPGLDEGTTWVFTSMENLASLASALEAKGIKGTTSLAFVPKMTVDCSDEDYDKNLEAVAMLEELDDVDSVDLNMAIVNDDVDA